MEHSANGLLKKLNRQSKEADSIYYNIAVRLGLSENTFWVLYALTDTTRQYSQQDICEEWSFSKQTVNSTISGLVEKGYVYLERAPNSKKRKTVKLTDAGKAFVHDHFLLMREAEEKALSRMTGKEREDYVALSEKYVAYLREEADFIYRKMNADLLVQSKQGGKRNV